MVFQLAFFFLLLKCNLSLFILSQSIKFWLIYLVCRLLPEGVCFLFVPVFYFVDISSLNYWFHLIISFYHFLVMLACYFVLLRRFCWYPEVLHRFFLQNFVFLIQTRQTEKQKTQFFCFSIWRVWNKKTKFWRKNLCRTSGSQQNRLNRTK